MANISGNETDQTLNGTPNDDLITGGAGSEVIDGGAGNDTIDGGSGRDRMVGGLGDDIYYVNTSSDQVIEEGNSGTDQVFATVDFVLAANVENLVLVDSAGDIAGAGNGLNNTITGNSGNNLINGGGGDDTMIGGAGDDTYVVNSVGDSIIDSSGVDTVRCTIDYSLADGLENGRLLGFQDLSIEGNSAVNELIGNMGDNMIDGLGGEDLLTGGSGGDGFVASVNDGTYDTITDFTSGVDLMLVDAVAFGLFDMQTLTGFTKGGLDESDLAFIRADGGRDGNVDAQFIYDTRSQILSVDADGQGSGAAEAIFALAGSGVSIKYDDVYVLI
jgi:Ca2+-binding RTX toxin-like protein